MRGLLAGSDLMTRSIKAWNEVYVTVRQCFEDILNLIFKRLWNVTSNAFTGTLICIVFDCSYATICNKIAKEIVCRWEQTSQQPQINN